jgi:hypothetical protein
MAVTTEINKWSRTGANTRAARRVDMKRYVLGDVACGVCWKSTEVLGEHNSSIFRVKQQAKLETNMKQAACYKICTMKRNDFEDIFKILKIGSLAYYNSSNSHLMFRLPHEAPLGRCCHCTQRWRPLRRRSEFKSIVRVQRVFRRVYHKAAPDTKRILHVWSISP